MVHTITTIFLLILVPLLALQGYQRAAQETSNVARDFQADVKAPLDKISRFEKQSGMSGDKFNSYTSPKVRRIRSPPSNNDAAGVCDLTFIRRELTALRSELKAQVPCVPASGNVSTNLLNLEATIKEQAAIIRSLQDEMLSLKTRLSSVESTLQKNESWCPPSWSLFNNSCYSFISVLLKWLDAQSLCKRFMGHLVEINSAEENYFVYSLIQSNKVTKAWIGINDTVKDGDWVFTTSGRPLSYTNWRPGEPNNHLDTQEDCGSLEEQGLWNDVPCINYTSSSVCERSAFYLQITSIQ